MSEQLYRWVKASERMPDTTGRTICLRLGEPIIAYAVQRNNGVMVFETPANSVYKGYKDFEWLEPYTPPLDIDKVVEQLRQSDPYDNEEKSFRNVWSKCCDKLKELLNQSK